MELKVGAKENGFSMELWTDSPDLYAVALISPDGEYSGRTEARIGESRRIPFLFTNTVVYIDYLIVSAESGDECIRIRFENLWRGFGGYVFLMQITIRVFLIYGFRFAILSPMRHIFCVLIPILQYAIRQIISV